MVPSERIVSTPISPAQAAQVAGVSRRTITRAISAQSLRATRDNRNQWRITPEDLEAWISAQPAQWAPSGYAQGDAHAAHQAAHPDEELREEATALRVEVRMLREALDAERAAAADLRKSRDEAVAVSLALAQQQHAPVPIQPAQGWPSERLEASEPPKASRGFLARLLGR